MDALTQVVTILAVILGGLTTWLTNHVSERSRRRLEFSTRWDEKKLDAYADFIGRARAYIYASVLLYEVREEIRISARSEHELREELTREAVEQSLAFERVMLLAGDAVVEAAHAVQGATIALGWQARGQIDGTLLDWRARNTTAFEAINRFHERARIDLGVTGRFDGEEHSARGLLLPEARSGEGTNEAT